MQWQLLYLLVSVLPAQAPPAIFRHQRHLGMAYSSHGKDFGRSPQQLAYLTLARFGLKAVRHQNGMISFRIKLAGL